MGHFFGGAARHNIDNLAAAALCVIACHGLAIGQTLDARRTGMGGVTLPGGAGGDGSNAAYRAVIGPYYPAMAVVQVVRLVAPEARVEIEATAVIP